MTRFQDILKSLNNIILGAITVLFILFLSFISYTTSSDDLVEMSLVYAVLVLCYFVCVVLYAVFYTEKYKEKQEEIEEAKAISILPPDKIVLSSAENFQYDIMVTIYYYDDKNKYAIIYGTGRVWNIQDDGFVVVEILETNKDNIESHNIKFSNTIDFLDHLTVKPNVKFQDVNMGGLH